MDAWIKSVYSDGTRGFVSSPVPSLGERITVSVRMLPESSIKTVFLRRLVNGAEEYIALTTIREKNGLRYYSGELTVNEPRITYRFVIVCEDVIYFYNQAGVTTYVPEGSSDFVLLADYVQPSWVRGAVLYQIFPSSFAGGTLYGIREKIPYLQELGVSAVYLNPVFSAPSQHKYDCTDYFHVDENFGGDDALAALSAALHEAEIRLILDISINHTGIEHPWVREKRHFYFEEPDGSLKGWAGYKGLPVLDYRNEELRDIVYRGRDAALRKWLRPPYSIDGWRFDVADVFARNDDVQIAEEVWREVVAAIREENPEAFIIGEHWGDCDCYLHGDLWNTPMNYFGFGRIIRQFLGLPELFLSRNEVLATIPYRMSAEDVVRRTEEHYRTLPQVIQDAQMNLFDSHDVPRIHHYPEMNFKKWSMAVTAQLLWTGMPCVYYGDEAAIGGYIEHDSGFRFEMPPERTAEGERYYAFYRKALSLRRESAAFAEGGRMVLFAEERVLAIARFLEDEIYVGVLSMEDKVCRICLRLYLIGAAGPSGEIDLFGMPVSGRQEGDGIFLLEMPAQSSLLFSCRTMP